MINDFLVGLQFLTRLRLTGNLAWDEQACGRSVRYFPLVGAVLGLCLVAAYQVLYVWLPGWVSTYPPTVAVTLLTALPILLTGGLHCDGFMDTMDGLFSGRQQPRMLEIMKDSRVGAHGVTTFLLLFALKWSLVADLATLALPAALFAMPVLGRLAMVVAITCFPYARQAGLGRAFSLHAGEGALWVALVLSLLLVLPLGLQGMAALVAALACAFGCGYWISRKLGGLTGDVYGAVTELTEAAVLAAFLW